MSSYNQAVLKLMTALDITKEEAIAVVEAAAKDPQAFKKRARLIEDARSAPDERKITGLQFRLNKPNVGRNSPCPCGSGKKYKKCCIVKERMIGVIAHREKE